MPNYPSKNNSFFSRAPSLLVSGLLVSVIIVIVIDVWMHMVTDGLQGKLADLEAGQLRPTIRLACQFVIAQSFVDWYF